ncbi:MAG: tryptophan synthase subunit alpha [Patescibacteria group bacterium]
MNDFDQLFANTTKSLFMAHMIAGYPSMEISEKIAEALVKGGADIIELQIPFSDPMADGPTIAVASEEALKAGATVAKSLELLKKVAGLGKPVAVMSYINPVFRYGIPKFVKTIATAGASALIAPDCPFDTEEGQSLLFACKENDIALIPVVSPGVPEERLKQLAKNASGFVYCTSRQGITGATSKFAKDLENFAVVAKRVFNLPLAVGFGVKSREDVQSLAKFADIVIAGSVFVNVIKQTEGSNILSVVEKTVDELVH